MWRKQNVSLQTGPKSTPPVSLMHAPAVDVNLLSAVVPNYSGQICKSTQMLCCAIIHCQVVVQYRFMQWAYLLRRICFDVPSAQVHICSAFLFTAVAHSYTVTVVTGLKGNIRRPLRKDCKQVGQSYLEVVRNVFIKDVPIISQEQDGKYAHAIAIKIQHYLKLHLVVLCCTVRFAQFPPDTNGGYDDGNIQPCFCTPAHSSICPTAPQVMPVVRKLDLVMQPASGNGKPLTSEMTVKTCKLCRQSRGLSSLHSIWFILTPHLVNFLVE